MRRGLAAFPLVFSHKDDGFNRISATKTINYQQKPWDFSNKATSQWIFSTWILKSWGGYGCRHRDRGTTQLVPLSQTMRIQLWNPWLNFELSWRNVIIWLVEELVVCNDSQYFYGYKWTIFYSYVKFPEGKSLVKIQKLVGALEPWNFMTFHILGMSSSQLTNSYFSEG